jgi:signal transduction histidine kinase
MVALVVIDVVVGTRAFMVVKPALAADAAVGVALVAAILQPSRLRLAATLAAAAASLAISRAVDVIDVIEYSPVMGRGAWPGFAELAGLGVLTAWCVRASRRAGAIVALLALGAAFAGLVAWRQQGPYPNELTVLFSAAWLTVAVAGMYLRMLDHRQEEHALRARQEERIAIARELHDMVAHHVTGIVVQAQAARLVAGPRPDVASRALEAIERAGGEALGAMRSMVGTLRDESTPADVAPTASLDDLRAIADPPARGELPVRLVLDAHAETLPREVVASLHRIAREAVTNARRHATGATSIDVDVSCRNGHVHLLVSNDGTPASRSSGGYGLTGMAERAAALGGHFAAGPVPTGGWRVSAELPVAAP